MMSIVTESGSQEKFSFGEIKYRDDKTKLIEEIRLLNDQNKILKNRIRDSIREIKEREKDVQSWRSGIFFQFLRIYQSFRLVLSFLKQFRNYIDQSTV